MKGVEKALDVVRSWIDKTGNDLLAATHLLKLGARAPTDAVCFHAQQAAEKYLKALLAFRGLEFPKTHDLDALARRLPYGLRSRLHAIDLAELTRHATVTRYPGAAPVSLAAARIALAAARPVRASVRDNLPKKAIQNGKRLHLDKARPPA